MAPPPGETGAAVSPGGKLKLSCPSVVLSCSSCLFVSAGSLPADCWAPKPKPEKSPGGSVETSACCTAACSRATCCLAACCTTSCCCAASNSFCAGVRAARARASSLAFLFRCSSAPAKNPSPEKVDFTPSQIPTQPPVCVASSSSCFHRTTSDPIASAAAASGATSAHVAAAAGPSEAVPATTAAL